jgi:hypothetical protein
LCGTLVIYQESGKENDEIDVVNKERTNHRAAPYTSQIAEECGMYPLLKQEVCRMSA